MAVETYDPSTEETEGGLLFQDSLGPISAFQATLGYIRESVYVNNFHFNISQV